MTKLANWTAEEERAVVNVWEKAMRALPDAGIEFFITWYASHPDAQQKFRNIAGKSAEELRTNARLAAHSVKIFGGINSFIVCRAKPGAVQELLHDLRRDHANRHISKMDHEAFSDMLVQFLAKTFGKNLMNAAAVSGFCKLMAMLGEYTVTENE